MAFEAVLAIRWVLGVLLFGAGVAKLLVLRGFTESVISFRILPTKGARTFALLLPGIEICVGLGLPFRRFAPWPEIAAAGLFSFFALAIAITLVRGVRGAKCGCFGRRSKAAVSYHGFIKELLLVSLAVVAVGPGSAEWPGVLAVGAVGSLYVVARVIGTLKPSGAFDSGGTHPPS